MAVKNQLQIVLELQGWCAYWHAVAEYHYDRGEYALAGSAQRGAAHMFETLQAEMWRAS